MNRWEKLNMQKERDSRKFVLEENEVGWDIKMMWVAENLAICKREPTPKRICLHNKYVECVRSQNRHDWMEDNARAININKKNSE